MTKKQIPKFLVSDRVIIMSKMMSFEVEIVEVRIGSFGRIDYRIKPVIGSGEAWVTEDSLEPK